MPFRPDKLRASCRHIVAESALVELHHDRFAEVVIPADLAALPSWDDAGFPPVPDGRAVSWLLAYNAINYSYWPTQGPRWHTVVQGVAIGGDDEALGIMAALAGAPVSDPAWLEAMDSSVLSDWLAPAPEAGTLPLMPQRVAALQELGHAIAQHGPPEQWVQDRPEATDFVRRLAAYLPSWTDERTWRGERVGFFKRAQLATSMIEGRLGGGVFRDLEQLTAFADYRLPQVLRALGLLTLDPRLARTVEDGMQLPYGGEAEVALRAAAVDGAERLRDATGASIAVIDHFLWRTAVQLEVEGKVPAFHRTRCTDY